MQTIGHRYSSMATFAHPSPEFLYQSLLHCPVHSLVYGLGERNYQLLALLNSLGDDNFVNAEEVATLLDLAPLTIQQRKIPTLPAPVTDFRCQRWALGTIRRWIRERS